MSTQKPIDQMDMSERMCAGLPYLAADAPGRTSDEAARMCAEYQRLDLEDRDAAQNVLRELFASIGERVRLRPPLHVD